MKSFSHIAKNTLRQHRTGNLLVFTVLTILSVLNGQTTVFYLIYFFWWNELLRMVVDVLCYKKNPNAVLEEADQKRQSTSDLSGHLFLMSIYWVFIVVMFGFIAASAHADMLMVNMGVLFFKNWFFNANLLFVLLERILLHKTQQKVTLYFGVFNPAVIVLHISIIVGAALMFFVVNNYPDIFTPENRWGSALIVFPFLLLRMAMHYFTAGDQSPKREMQ